ncbi:unnamed protein product [Ectocarpus sp. 12 AP-2014]
MAHSQAPLASGIRPRSDSLTKVVHLTLRPKYDPSSSCNHHHHHHFLFAQDDGRPFKGVHLHSKTRHSGKFTHEIRKHHPRADISARRRFTRCHDEHETITRRPAKRVPVDQSQFEQRQAMRLIEIRENAS